MRSKSFVLSLAIAVVFIIALSTSSERTREQTNNGFQYAAPDEEYDIEKLSQKDQELLVRLSKSSSDRDRRSETIERLYHLNGENAWRRHYEALDDEGLPPLTKFAQNYIFEHQHPKSCSDKKFILMKNFPNDEDFGLGATVFSVSMNLNIGLRFDRILIYDSSSGPGRHFVDPSSDNICGKSLDCFFERLTSCTMDDLTAENTIVLPATKVLDQDLMSTLPGSLPPIFGFALKKMYPRITPDALKYWWRGQAVSYIMRFNGRTMAELLKRRTNNKLQKSLSLDGNEIVKASKIPFPMPQGSVSMHIRHGDKGIEMVLKPFMDYVKAAERLISQNPMGYQKIAFISTENPDVFKEATNHLQMEREKYKVIDPNIRTSRDWSWTWYWSDIPRANVGPEVQLEKFGNRTDTTINWLLQLMMALECDTMVGTRASGWSRLLDNLRCGWLAKCQQPFIDVGDKQDWVFYGI